MVIPNTEFILLCSAFILSIYMLFVIAKVRKSDNLTNMFFIVYFLMFLWDWCLILQVLLSDKYNINIFKFEYLTCISTCFFPLALYFLAKVFVKRDFKLKFRHIPLFIIPIFSLYMLWTNEVHGLFYKVYSTQTREIVYGPYFYIFIMYSYILIFFSIIRMWQHSTDKTGIFSKQSWILFLGTLIPILLSLLSWLSILNLSIYFIPIFITIGLICLLLSITKIKIFTIKKVAINKVLDIISDAFIVLDKKLNIIEYNKAFERVFGLEEVNILNENLFDIMKQFNFSNQQIKKGFIENMIERSKNSNKVIKFEYKISDINKYFEIQLYNLKQDRNFTVTIMVFRDITQHKKDIRKLKKHQEILMEQDRLASLGQLIGGIAHNLKTPIMSIAGNIQGLRDLVEEYNLSIRDEQVTTEDHDQIAQDMNELLDKAGVHLEYMSNIITTVKGQAIDSNIDRRETFTTLEVVSAVEILMKHELKANTATLKIEIPETYKDIRIKGQMNNLVQVINNLIQNAIHSYKDEDEKIIYLTVQKEEREIVFAIKDNGCGMPDKVKEKIFREMVTTKGKEGTGLGLYMSYSTVRGKYNGDITFKSDIYKGTTFFVRLPICDN